ncbi:hypothetical protein SPRG_17288 [Saprolegnia parasitica CBS 223.65]|uniref:Uncharacterized protein n=1 Tax=Saprolegnia parasitica (strain CBS 223.65) TaxID=695850 RepID=A0A067BKJ7_SAPPC|nr:hypothetical protein SPRG_17288 [Saprolegnia parasitica CBS 223.65]KDO17225.1 hypothetical protein SPRG_17288 [Saprolegnia parasitica CBS 223.65]|eukprot:XP_012212066.1 hypothetical protein SPRG_17288 [Saprolegnia parasitica CBS 223.65]
MSVPPTTLPTPGTTPSFLQISRCCAWIRRCSRRSTMWPKARMGKCGAALTKATRWPSRDCCQAKHRASHWPTSPKRSCWPQPCRVRTLSSCSVRAGGLPPTCRWSSSGWTEATSAPSCTRQHLPRRTKCPLAFRGTRRSNACSRLPRGLSTCTR